MWRLHLQVSYKGKTTNLLAGEHCPSVSPLKKVYSIAPFCPSLYCFIMYLANTEAMCNWFRWAYWQSEGARPTLAYSCHYVYLSLNILALDQAEWGWRSWCLFSCGKGWSHSLPPHHPAPPPTSDHWWLGQEQQGHPWRLDIWCQCRHLEGGIAIVCKCVYMYALYSI